MKTRKLEDSQLDYWAAKAAGYAPVWSEKNKHYFVLLDQNEGYKPSSDWSKAGPIIERERIYLYFIDGACQAQIEEVGRAHAAVGRTALEAAMRAYVASKFGDEVSDAEGCDAATEHPADMSVPQSQVGNFGDSHGEQLNRLLRSVPLPNYLDVANPAKTGQPACWCEKCRPLSLTDMRMILCPTCGNKRCPHATDHVLTCTGSNDVGQPGSRYEHAYQAKTEQPDSEINTIESLNAAQGSMDDFAEAADLVDKINVAETNGIALGLVLGYRLKVRLAALTPIAGAEQPEQPAADIRREALNRVCIDGHLNAALDAVMKSHSPDGTFNLLGTLAEHAIDIALSLAKHDTMTARELAARVRDGEKWELAEAEQPGLSDAQINDIALKVRRLMSSECERDFIAQVPLPAMRNFVRALLSKMALRINELKCQVDKPLNSDKKVDAVPRQPDSRNPSPDAINEELKHVHYRCRPCKAETGLHWYRGTSCPVCSKPECTAILDKEWATMMAQS